MANVKISELDTVAGLSGTESIVVVQDGVTKRALINDIPGDDPSTAVSIFTDFDTYSPTYSATIPAGIQHEWHHIVNSTGSISSLDAEAGRHGIIRLDTSTSTNARLAMRYGSVNATRLDDGASTTVVAFRLSDLPTAAQEYFCMMGFASGDTMGASVSALGISASDGYGPNWQLYKRAASVSTNIDTGIAVVAGAWIKVTIAISADGQTVDVDINGASFQQLGGGEYMGAGYAVGPVPVLAKASGHAFAEVGFGLL